MIALLALAAGLAGAQASALAARHLNGRLAYAPAGRGPSAQVFSVAGNGRGRIQLTHDPSGAAHPDWSPDGRSIAYDVGGTWIATAGADGSGERILGLQMSGIDPSWSRNGRQLAFSGVQYDQLGNVETAALYVANADGSNFNRIGAGSEPDWSPRRDLIVYRSDPARSGGCAGIWRIRPDGSHNQPVAEALLHGSVCKGGGSDPSFAPDGKHVVFVSGDGTTIYITGLSGVKKRRVFADGRAKSSPVYSPDVKKIAFTMSGALWLVNARGGKPKRLAAGSGHLAWQRRPR